MSEEQEPREGEVLPPEAEPRSNDPDVAALLKMLTTLGMSSAVQQSITNVSAALVEKVQVEKAQVTNDHVAKMDNQQRAWDRQRTLDKLGLAAFITLILAVVAESWVLVYLLHAGIISSATAGQIGVLLVAVMSILGSRIPRGGGSAGGGAPASNG